MTLLLKAYVYHSKFEFGGRAVMVVEVNQSSTSSPVRLRAREIPEYTRITSDCWIIRRWNLTG